MCGMSQDRAGVTACQYCEYEERPLEALSKKKVYDLLAPYDYERIEGGIRIVSVKNIRDIALRGSVAIPHFVTEIAPHAFAHCKFITRLDLPRGLRLIGEGAFAHCRDLFDVFIPERVDYIGKGAFSDCYDLSVISAAAPERPITWSDEWLFGSSARVEWLSTDEV